jgi:hypothetical protein
MGIGDVTISISSRRMLAAKMLANGNLIQTWLKKIAAWL